MPGAIRHWRDALRYSPEELGGTMRLWQALQPAMRIARDGFDISENFMNVLTRHRDRLLLYPESARIFLDCSLRPGVI